MSLEVKGISLDEGKEEQRQLIKTLQDPNTAVVIAFSMPKDEGEQVVYISNCPELVPYLLSTALQGNIRQELEHQQEFMQKVMALTQSEQSGVTH